ncbi:MAG: hypothetical protein ACYSWU_05595, partial [Planctomycetota bacterium]
MSRVRSALVLAMVFVLAGALFATAAEQGQRRGARGPQRGFGPFGRSSSLIGLLRFAQVQKELKLSDEQKSKVEEIGKKLQAERREQDAALRKIPNPQKRRAKLVQLRKEQDAKAREQLREAISREQLIRLYQIRVQINGTVYALSNEYVASRLKLTDEQKNKVAEIDKNAQQKQRKVFAGLRDASQEERGKAMAEIRKIRQSADKEALALLTAEQKEGLE